MVLIFNEIDRNQKEFEIQMISTVSFYEDLIKTKFKIGILINHETKRNI